jgi:hypothetical protein
LRPDTGTVKESPDSQTVLRRLLTHPWRRREAAKGAKGPAQSLRDQANIGTGVGGASDRLVGVLSPGFTYE